MFKISKTDANRKDKSFHTCNRKINQFYNYIYIYIDIFVKTYLMITYSESTFVKNE